MILLFNTINIFFQKRRKVSQLMDSFKTRRLGENKFKVNLMSGKLTRFSGNKIVENRFRRLIRFLLFDFFNQRLWVLTVVENHYNVNRCIRIFIEDCCLPDHNTFS